MGKPLGKQDDNTAQGGEGRHPGYEFSLLKPREPLGLRFCTLQSTLGFRRSRFKKPLLVLGAMPCLYGFYGFWRLGEAPMIVVNVFGYDEIFRDLKKRETMATKI